jgi:hypothetical protein
VLSRWPVETPTDWIDWVNGQRTAAELDGLRKCVNRGAPYGSEGWRKRIANMLNLESTLHPRGRPRKESRQLHVVQRFPARQLDLAQFSPGCRARPRRPPRPIARRTGAGERRATLRHAGSKSGLRAGRSLSTLVGLIKGSGG